jgi:hypothetical protein
VGEQVREIPRRPPEGESNQHVALPHRQDPLCDFPTAAGQADGLEAEPPQAAIEQVSQHRRVAPREHEHSARADDRVRRIVDLLLGHMPAHLCERVELRGQEAVEHSAVALLAQLRPEAVARPREAVPQIRPQRVAQLGVPLVAQALRQPGGRGRVHARAPRDLLPPPQRRVGRMGEDQVEQRAVGPGQAAARLVDAFVEAHGTDTIRNFYCSLYIVRNFNCTSSGRHLTARGFPSRSPR